MGIIHLAPVGRSPGAVTAALAHLKHVYNEQQRTGQRLEKSVLPRRLGYPVEQIVLFVSDEVYRGRPGSLDTIYNQYGAYTPIRSYPEKDRIKVVDIIAEFAKKELSDGKLALYARRVDVNNFEDCFRTIAETVLALGRPDDLGKTLWANLTGGTNILNAALLEVTFLSGLINSLYYIFANEDERKFLQPLSKDYWRFVEDHWRDVPVVKTAFDERYRHLLFFLSASPQDWWETDRLFYALLQEFSESFHSITLELFQKQWLRKMGREIDWELNEAGQELGRIGITEEGCKTIERLEGGLFRTLVQRGEAPLVDVQELRDKLEQSRVEL